MIWISVLVLILFGVTIVTVWKGYQTLNSLWVMGNFYWILRDSGAYSQPILGFGFMRQTSSPWKTGKGIQIRVGKYVHQMGICKKSPELAEQEGLLYSIQGRILETPTKEIGDWL